MNAPKLLTISGTFRVREVDMLRILSSLGSDPSQLIGQFTCRSLENGIEITNTIPAHDTATAVLTSHGLEIPARYVAHWGDQLRIEHKSFKEFRLRRGEPNPEFKCSRHANGRIFITPKTMHNLRYRFAGMKFMLRPLDADNISITLLAD